MKFTESHEWIRMEGDVGIVGITAHAQKELGDIVFVELPILGKIVRALEETVVLESTKAAADVYTPVSGQIIAINEDLKKSCSSLNQSPEQEGWLYKIKVSNPAELNTLMDRDQYRETVSK